MFYIIPNSLRDAINAKLDAAFAERPDAEQDREHLYSQLVAHFNEHGVVPDFSLVKSTENETEPRNIYNNPSGKSFCCHIPCGADATWFVEQVGGSPYDDYTESCDEHLAAMVRLHGPESLVYPIKVADESLKGAVGA